MLLSGEILCCSTGLAASRRAACVVFDTATCAFIGARRSRSSQPACVFLEEAASWALPRCSSAAGSPYALGLAQMNRLPVLAKELTSDCPWIQKSPVFLGVPQDRTAPTAASRTLTKLRWLSPLAVHGPAQISRGRRIKAHITSAYRFKKRQIRGVDDLHRPEARGAFAAAFLALQRQHELSSRPTLQVEPPDAGRHGRHDARRARTQYHDGAGHR